MDAQASFLDQLFAAGLLIGTGVPGLYGRGETFEAVVAGFEALVDGVCGPAERIRFPPGMNQAQFAASGYMKSFPQLGGMVHSFCGDAHAHNDLMRALDAGDGTWAEALSPTEVALTPAACYPLYPIVGGRGPLAPEGGHFDLQSYVFRHEPSRDPTRMQMFRQREWVRLGDAEQVLAFRRDWFARGQALMTRLGLPFTLEIANDPFFGRGGRILAIAQREQQLKFELLVPIVSDSHPSPCLSFNYHQDHFGQMFGIRTADGQVAHTACVGFGLERVALALFRHHGLDVADWPAPVRQALWG